MKVYLSAFRNMIQHEKSEEAVGRSTDVREDQNRCTHNTQVRLDPRHWSAGSLTA
jgi:hypothetical protein